MKTNRLLSIAAVLLLLSILNPQLSTAFAGTTIDPVNRYAYGANIGWMDWRGDTNNGVVIGAYVCSGYIYSANVGWINLGSGAPADGIYYQNTSASDFGVNNDGLGNLSGYAWGANIGWIHFESTGAPKVNMLTGQLSGYAWSANCGWISLSNAVAYVQTDTIAPGADTDGDGIPDAWELQQFGNLTTANGTSDYDGDGVSDKNEYLAGTNPKDANDYLRITSESFASGGSSATLTWSSVPTRVYYIQKTLALNPLSTWFDSGLNVIPPSAGSTTTSSFADTNAAVRFYRVEAVRPLAP
jgi:hypothetical protein